MPVLETDPAVQRQRLDKWLWHARIVRTRSAAADLASSGHVRINGARAETASAPVRIGDVITVALDRRVRLLKVEDFVARRGSAEDAGGLYRELPPEGMAGETAASLAKPPPIR